MPRTLRFLPMLAAGLGVACGGGGSPPGTAGDQSNPGPAVGSPAAPGIRATDASPVATVDVCGLFTAEDAEAVVGQAMRISNRTAGGYIPHGYCQYNSTTPEEQQPAGVDGVFLEVRVYDDRGVASVGDHPDAASLYRALKQAFAARGDRLTELSGLGEDAHDNGGLLKALQGPYLVEVQMTGLVSGPEGPARRLEAATRVARVILGRL